MDYEDLAADDEEGCDDQARQRGQRRWEENYWAQLAAIVIKNKKSRSLCKLIGRVDNY
jgi:hypothetical protein